MVNIFMALLLLLVVLFICPAVLIVVDTLTLAPFRWYMEATDRYSYAWLFTVYILLLLFQTAVWLFGFVVLGIGKTLLLHLCLHLGVWWSLAFWGKALGSTLSNIMYSQFWLQLQISYKQIKKTRIWSQATYTK